MSDGGGTQVVVVTACLSLVVAVITLLYGEGILTPSLSSPFESPMLKIPSPTSLPTLTPVETSLPPTATTTPTPSGGTGLTVVPQYLHQMRAVDRGRYGNVLRVSPFSINGKPYPHSFSFYNSCNNSDGGDILAEYNFGRGCAVCVGGCGGGARCLDPWWRGDVGAVYASQQATGTTATIGRVTCSAQDLGRGRCCLLRAVSREYALCAANGARLESTGRG